MNTTIFYIILSVVLVSLVSFIGALTLVFSEKRVKHILLSLVSLSAGTLFGGAFLHLIPEAVEESGSLSAFISLLILFGIVSFFLLDKLIHWKHSHKDLSLIHTKTEARKSVMYLNLLGDGLHNLLDGLIIAGSYLVSIPAGIATTLAVVIHETPQEIADFGVLLYSGLSKWKALMFNFFSASIAILGAVVGILIGSQSESFIKLILPFAAGSFIYIAGSNLIPELLDKEHKFKDILLHFVAFIAGILIMYGLLFFE